MISRDLRTKIRHLFFAEHWKTGTIVAQLGVHHDTVASAIESNRFGNLRYVDRSSSLDPYKGLIDGWLIQYPRLRATRIFDMLTPRGFTGRVGTVRRYVRVVRRTSRSEAFLRLETLPGEQAQVDWAHFGKIRIGCAERVLSLFVMVLSWSRAVFARFALDQSMESFLRGHVLAFEALGGPPRTILYDNLKSAVLERDGDHIRFHPRLLELAGHYHFMPRACAPYRGNEKGKAERRIQDIRHSFFAARHPVQHERTVGECLAEERERLLPLPGAPAASDHVLPVRVDKTATVRFETNFYSVPPTHVERTLTLAVSDTTVRVLDGTEQVATHARCWGRRQIVEVTAHREEILAMKRAGRDLKGRDRLRVVVPEIDVLLRRWLEAGRNIGSVVGRTVVLLNLYGDDVLIAAVAEMIERGTEDFGALAALCEKHRRVHERPVPIDVDFGSHVTDREVIPHNLETYDARRPR